MTLTEDVKKDVERVKPMADWKKVVIIWTVVGVLGYIAYGPYVDLWVYNHYWIINIVMGIAMFVFIYKLLRHFMDGFGENK